MTVTCPTCHEAAEFLIKHIGGWTKMETKQTTYLEHGWYVHRFFVNNVLRHTCWEKA